MVAPSHQHCGGHYHCTLGSDRDIGQADILLALSPSNLQGARGFGRKAVIKMTKYHKHTKDSCGLIVKKKQWLPVLELVMMDGHGHVT